MKKYTTLLALLFIGVLTGYCQQSAYLFVYFTGNRMSEEAIRMAVSLDGYNYKALNGNQPVLDSRVISSTGGVRDPHILRCENGKTFYMVVTDMVSGNGWDSNRAMVLLKSKDLVHWTSNIVNIQKKYPAQENLKRVWAPQTVYDKEAGKYMVYWSMKHGNGAEIQVLLILQLPLWRDGVLYRSMYIPSVRNPGFYLSVLPTVRELRR